MLSISALTHHRWALPLLAELDGTGGSRFVPLQNRLGLSREALRQTLEALVDLGLVMRNPGYGHPSRPEYVLTDRGRVVAPACAAVVDSVGDLADVAFKKWSLPVLVELGEERRYADLLRAVGATPRALSLALKDLGEAGFVERRVHDGYPPSTTYGATRRSQRARERVAMLAAAL